MRDEVGESRQRRSMYRLLIVATLAIAAGRIAVVTRDGETAFLSANDRSRWSTVASLVEHGTYVIDSQEAIVIERRGRRLRPWATIDKVVHTGRDGQRHYYSSKPPLFPTLVAGLYAVVRPLLGMTLTEQPMYMTRIMLALVNLPMLALFLITTIASIERIGRNAFTRQLLALATCFGTMLLPFTVSLNNHLPAAAATALVIWIYLVSVAQLRGDEQGERQRWLPFWWLIAGVAAAFAVANELPALSMLGLWGVLFLLLRPASLAWMSAGAAVVAAAFFGTNWIAHQSFRPPYAHRGNGDLIAELPSAGSPSELADEIGEILAGRGLAVESIEPSDEAGRWVVRTRGNRSWFALLDRAATTLESSVATEPSPSDRWQLAEWDDWYEYPGTHWKPENLTGVDRGEPSRTAYLFHMTIGHHGLFSLTPLWVLVPLGLIFGVFSGPSELRRLMAATAIASAVCFLFYLARPEIDRNYGGVSACFRWLLWFAPLWLMAIVPAVDRWSTSAGFRGMVNALLAISIFSVSTALVSPWQHPWLYQFWAFLGWIDPS